MCLDDEIDSNLDKPPNSKELYSTAGLQFYKFAHVIHTKIESSWC